MENRYNKHKKAREKKELNEKVAYTEALQRRWEKKMFRTKYMEKERIFGKKEFSAKKYDDDNFVASAKSIKME